MVPLLSSLFWVPVITFTMWYTCRRLRARRPRPPSPAIPEISSGNHSKEQPWKVYRDWATRLGPIISSPWNNIIILDTPEAAFELLEKRSRIYSSRPQWTMANLIGRQSNVGFTPYGDRLKKARRFLHNSLNLQALAQWRPFLSRQTLDLMDKILRSPIDLRHHVHRMVESTIVEFTYGREIDDEYIALARTVAQQTNIALQPGAWWVNTVPALKYMPSWFPGASFKRWARECRSSFIQLTRPPFAQVKEEMNSGTARPSFVRQNLEDIAGSPTEVRDEDILIGTAGSVFDAGVGTTVSVILTFFLMMARHPEIQERAFLEIVSTVGRERLPNLEDRDYLPYVECILKELLRFHPPVPLVTHTPIQEDIYNGYRIPRNSWVTSNLWSMLHDEKTYPKPDEFIPERFMSTPEPNSEHILDPNSIVFGFGRRICPGNHFANALIYLTIARTLSLFEIKPIEGKPPPLAFSTGLMSSPKPFRCLVTARSDLAPDAIAQAMG